MRHKTLIVVLLIAVAGAVGFYVLLTKSGPPQPANPVPVAPAGPPVNIDELKAKAEAGDVASQIRLGWAYQKGEGTKPNMKEAVKWFRKAADQNAPDALAALGEMTQAGQGVQRDVKEAVRLYRLAAEQGSVAGQYNLAYLYEQGEGVVHSETNAAHWYRLAAEGGDPIAQYDLGQRYMLGVGVSTNRIEACKWLTLAAVQGQADSGRLLPDLKSQMSFAEIAEAGRLVKDFAPRASTNSVP
jgi:hypothetical protein